MVDTTDIENKSLEAHVELCAERYKFLENKLDTLETTIAGVKNMVEEVHDMVQTMAQKRNDQLIAWGVGIIGSLLATIGWLVSTYILK